MGFFMPNPDSQAGYFGSADLSGLKLGDLFRSMPFGVPLETIGSMPLGRGTATDDGSYQEAGGPPCDGPDCQSGGSYGTTGMYGMRGRHFCFDCAVKERGIEGLSAAEKAEYLAPYIIGGGGTGIGGGANVGGNPKLKGRFIQKRY